MLSWVHTKMVELMAGDEGTYEDLYGSFSRSTQDWMGEFHPPEGRQGVSEGFMNLMIGSLRPKWRRNSQDAARRSPETVNLVFAPLTKMSVYEWQVLVY